jgi:thiol-disulfide isomerase/thioredoxin
MIAAGLPQAALFIMAALAPLLPLQPSWVAGLAGLRAHPMASRAKAQVVADQQDAEARVINYIRDHLQPGEPLVVSELYGKVFKQPDEQQALSKLYNAFFRIPLFLVQYQEKYGSPPRLETISQQFDLKAPGAADVLLRVMQNDPRVPRFLTRDPKTGAITHVDVNAVRSDPRFAQAVERQLSGWEGKAAPDLSLTALDGSEINSAALRGKTVLLYVWFTGCPPCMKETPILVALQSEFSGRGFTIVGANADQLLGLDYSDSVRGRYVKEHHVNFPVGNWTAAADAAYGKISIFPTLFLIGRKGIIARHWVGYVPAEELKQALVAAL